MGNNLPTTLCPSPAKRTQAKVGRERAFDVAIWRTFLEMEKYCGNDGAGWHGAGGRGQGQGLVFPGMLPFYSLCVFR